MFALYYVTTGTRTLWYRWYGVLSLVFLKRELKIIIIIEFIIQSKHLLSAESLSMEHEKLLSSWTNKQCSSLCCSKHVPLINLGKHIYELQISQCSLEYSWQIVISQKYLL